MSIDAVSIIFNNFLKLYNTQIALSFVKDRAILVCQTYVQLFIFSSS